MDENELADPSASDSAALSVEGVRKSFASVTVLHDVDLLVRPGSVHALVGHNGSGKSTLIKALAGFHAPDRPVTGEVFGEQFTVGDHASAAGVGLRFVHQDLGLVEEMSTTDNLALGTGYPRMLGALVRRRRAASRARKAMVALGYDVDVNVPVGSLSSAERTGVAIARALQGWSGKPAVVVLDEPTASMPAAEVQRLFEAVRRLREQGLGVVYVSHHLDEILELADDVTVLRNGKVVLSRTVSGLTHDDLVTAIVGRSLAAEMHRPGSAGTRPAGDPVLTVDRLETSTLGGISFTVAPGEIVGVAGIVGSGRDDVVPCIAGALPRNGTVSVGAHLVSPGRPKAAISAGIGVLPADRRRVAVLPTFAASWNLTVSGVQRYVRYGLLNRRAEASDVAAWFDKLDVTPRNPQAPILTLSGGNQQKVMVGRWLRCSPKVLALDEPTQGVDVGAQATIYRLIDQVAKTGSGILISSSDGDELAAVCHRVLVLAHGRVIAELSGPDVDAERIDALCLESAGAVSS